MIKCNAIVRSGRIQLMISKETSGYMEFVNVLQDIEKNGILTWYGDTTDELGKESCGLIISSQPMPLCKVNLKLKKRGKNYGR